MVTATGLSASAAAAFILLSFSSFTSGFTIAPHQNAAQRIKSPTLHGSFFDDLFGANKDESQQPKEENPVQQQQQQQDEDNLSLAAFQQEVSKREPQQEDDDDDEEFDGYVMRDIIVEKWGQAFDLEFQRVEAMGFKEVYLNVMPFRLGSRKFRHATELDYLCHLQAVVEILLKYDQVGNILYQIDATNKKPRAGTSPLLAVPLKLDLTPEQVDKILGP